MQKHFILVVAMFMSAFADSTQTQDFIVKKEKQASTSVLKEQMGDYITRTLKMTPLTVGYTADLQRECMDICEDMLEGSFFTTRSKEDIVSLHVQAQEMCERQEEINELVKQQQQAVKLFKNKLKK